MTTHQNPASPWGKRSVRLSYGGKVVYGKTGVLPTPGSGFFLVCRTTNGGFYLHTTPPVQKVLSEHMGDIYFRAGDTLYLAKVQQ